MSGVDRDINRDARASHFITSLAELEPQDLAQLKRCAGRSLAESRLRWRLAYTVLPYGLPERQEDIFFMVATLYALAPSQGKANLGAALRHARTERNRVMLDRNMERLLKADGSQLTYLLRRLIPMLASAGLTLEWSEFLKDILHWSYQGQLVQRKWARSYFSGLQ